MAFPDWPPPPCPRNPLTPNHKPLRAAALEALCLRASAAFPLAPGSSAGGRGPFCPKEPGLGTRGGHTQGRAPTVRTTPSSPHAPIYTPGHPSTLCGSIL